MRVAASFLVKDTPLFKRQALAWASSFSVCCLLDNHGYTHSSHHRQEFLLGAGVSRELITSPGNNFTALKDFISANPDWAFGFLTYDLKNETERLSSNNMDGLAFPLLHFFIPEIVIELKDEKAHISSLSKDPASIFNTIEQINPDTHVSPATTFRQPTRRTHRDKYLANVEAIRQHIRRGDVYELNYCQEFYLEDVSINPLTVYKRLGEISPTPFGAFYKLNDKYLLCASPERFLQKQGNRLTSQPIKGTIRRGTNPQEDEQLKNQLKQDQKERSENVMIVDLVRNDLSRACQPGTVQVEELYGIYTYPQVHQMISTITGELKPGVHFTEAIKHCFPMGSMTGAPKIEAMKLIEQYEDFRRGLFSGAVGYISPNGDFDLNVVIRSMLYYQSSRYLSFSTGGAITYASVPEKEYEESLLKAQAMMRALNGDR